MRAALLLALWPALGSAEGPTHVVWGNPVEGSGPSALSLEACDLPCVAVVRFDNTLVTHGTGDGIGAPPLVRATLAIPGVAMAVTVEAGGGLTPDLLKVLPPPGYAAEPREVLVEDNASGRVRVVLGPTS
jgi:hypothetical protein